jgi:hypothetical protein
MCKLDSENYVVGAVWAHARHCYHGYAIPHFPDFDDTSNSLGGVLLSTLHACPLLRTALIGCLDAGANDQVTRGQCAA